MLVGTIAIETSEMLAAKLKNRGIRHNVLNAKQHDREAEIVAQAGRFGSVTISTNMAGRGTDIVLGGNPIMMMRARGLDAEAPENKDELDKLTKVTLDEREKVVAAGGLHVLGTERHESRRIDNQLRGRSGRQGDPGSSRFYLSLEDDLLRIFGSDRISGLMKRLGMQEGEAIEARMLSGAIERAQRKVEVRNFDIRKHLLEYDDVMNKQRESIYRWRTNVLASKDMRGEYLELAHELAAEIVAMTFASKSETDVEGFVRETQAQFALAFDPASPELARADREVVLAKLLERVDAKLDEKVEMFADIERQYADFRPPSFDGVSRGILLQTLDQLWKDHLLTMDHLKEGVGLQGYAGKDPKRVYQTEGFELFREMFDAHPLARRRAALPRGARAAVARAHRGASRGRRGAPRRARAQAPGGSRRVAVGGARRGRADGDAREARRSAATIRARAAPARSSRSATGSRRASVTVEVPGFLAAGIACGIKPSGKPDLALIVSDRLAAAAAVFTTSRFPGAPVVVSRSHIRSRRRARRDRQQRRLERGERRARPRGRDRDDAPARDARSGRARARSRSRRRA